MLVSPYLENGKGLMFRLANLRRNILIDLQIEILFSFNENVDGKIMRRFYPLEVERRKCKHTYDKTGAIVHPLDDNSPLKDYDQGRPY